MVCFNIHNFNKDPKITQQYWWFIILIVTDYYRKSSETLRYLWSINSIFIFPMHSNNQIISNKKSWFGSLKSKQRFNELQMPQKCINCSTLLGGTRNIVTAFAHRWRYACVDKRQLWKLKIAFVSNGVFKFISIKLLKLFTITEQWKEIYD